jgi:hypothetical protein
MIYDVKSYRRAIWWKPTHQFTFAHKKPPKEGLLLYLKFLESFVVSQMQ